MGLTLTTSSVNKALINYSLLLLFFVPACLLAAEKSNDAQQLKSAISLRQANNHQQAVELLEDLLKDHSDHKRINIELAINYIKLADFNRSQEILDHLKTLDLTDNENKKLANLIKLVASKQHKQASTHKFSTDVSVFYGVDRYTSKFPIYEYYEFFDQGDDYLLEDYSEELVEVRSEEVQHNKEHYLAQQIKGFYRYRPSNTLTLFGQQTQIIFTGVTSWYQRQLQRSNNGDDDPKYKQAKFDAALSFLTEKKWLFNIKYRGRSHFQNSARILTDHGFALSGSFPLKDGRITLGFEHKRKNYNKDYRHNNATINSPSIEYSYLFKPAIKFKVGTRYRIYQASDEFNRYRNTNLYASLHFTPTDSLTAFLSYNHSDLAYTIDDPELVHWGSEMKSSWLSGLKYQLTDRLYWGVNLHHIDNAFDRDAGNNKWQRIEATVNYQF